MAKKKFTNSFQDIFTPTTNDVDSSSSACNRDEEVVRTTILMNPALYKRIKAIAHWERKAIKDIINEAFVQRIDQYSEEEMRNIEKLYESN